MLTIQKSKTQILLSLHRANTVFLDTLRMHLLPDPSAPSSRRDRCQGPEGSAHATCPLALVFLASTLLVFSKLLWVSRRFTGPFNIFNGFF